MKNLNVFVICFLVLGTLSIGFAALGDTVSSKDIVIDITVNKPIKEAWSLWTENKRIETWLTVKANVEPKLRGHFELFWEPERPNQNSTIGCTILSIEPHKLIAFQWKGPVPFADIMNTNPPPTWVIVSFESIDSHSTLIHFRHSGWKTGEHWDKAREWQKNAWLAAFEEMRKITN